MIMLRIVYNIGNIYDIAYNISHANCTYTCGIVRHLNLPILPQESMCLPYVVIELIGKLLTTFDSVHLQDFHIHYTRLKFINCGPFGYWA